MNKYSRLDTAGKEERVIISSMVQNLVIVRGPACSGKTTICREIRNYDKKIAMVSVDNTKLIFSNFKDETLDDVHKSVNVILADLLDRGFSVVLEGILKKPIYTKEIIEIAKKRNIPYVIYQLECSLEALKARDRSREGVTKKGYDPLGDELIESIYKTVEGNPIEGAIKINTEEKTIEECIEIIRKNFD